jgi:hypothetical protein
MRRVRNYVRTGEGPDGWTVIAMAENEGDLLKRLGRRCDTCGATVVITPDASLDFILLSDKLCVRPA